MNIFLYNYGGEFNRLNKILENGISISCDFNMDYNKINPTIKLAYGNNFDFNYCYITDFDKYYFIDSVTVKRNGFIICGLIEDVLMTFKDVILQSKGTVTMSSNGLYLSGVGIPTTSKTSMVKYEFNDVFNHNGDYVLISSGYVE